MPSSSARPPKVTRKVSAFSLRLSLLMTKVAVRVLPGASPPAKVTVCAAASTKSLVAPGAPNCASRVAGSVSALKVRVKVAAPVSEAVPGMSSTPKAMAWVV